MKRKVTLKQIAKELDVSISTVSKSLRNSLEISEDTRQKVQAFAKLYNYKPNNIALSLKNKKTKTICIIIPEIIHHFFATVISGVEHVANEHGTNFKKQINILINKEDEKNYNICFNNSRGLSTVTVCKTVKNANNTQKGVAIGAAAGAILGGVLGNNVGKGGNGALGAVLGGIIGGAAGGVIGDKMDKQARQIQNSLPGAQVERVGEGIKLTLGENSVRFDFNKSTLTPGAKANLDKLVPVFKEYADTDIKIFGYTDSKGTDEYNLKLSEQRAESVKNYFASKGLNVSRFHNVGMGEADPIGDSETDAGRVQNRRVEFSIVANDKIVEDAKKEAGQ